MSHYKKLANDSLIYGLGTIIPRFLNFIVLTPFYTRKMEIFEYGVFSEIYTYAVLLMIILTYGTETGYFKFANDENLKEKNVFNNIFTMLLISSLIFIFSVNMFVPHISKVMQYGGSNIQIRLFSGILFFDVISSIPFAKLRQERRIIRFSIFKLINVIVNLSLIFLFFRFLPNINIITNNEFIIILCRNRVTLALMANLIASIITFGLLYQEVIKVKLNLDKILIKKILIYSWPLLIAGISGSINDTLDKLLLKFLGSYEQLAIYNASYKLAVIITLFIQMFRYAAEPYFFSIEKEKESNIVYANVMKYFLISILTIFLIVILYIDYFKWYIGPNFRSGLYIIPIVLLANVLFGILININFWFKLSGKTNWAIGIVGLGAFVTIIGNIILIPFFGILGSAWSRVFAYLSMILFSYFLGRKYYRINYNLKEIGFYIILTSIIFAAGYYIEIKDLILKTIYSTVLLVIYLYIVNKKEKLINTFIKK